MLSVCVWEARQRQGEAYVCAAGAAAAAICQLSLVLSRRRCCCRHILRTV